MKRITSIIISLLCFSCFCQSKELVLISGTTTTLRKAISQLDGVGTINIDGRIIIDSNVTIPSGIKLKITEKGIFNIENAVQFKIEGVILAGYHRIFTDQVVFSEGSIPEIHSEWFGNNEMAVNYALLSAKKIPVRIAEDIIVTNTIYIESYQTLLINNGTKILPSRSMVGSSVITNKNETDTDITIIGGTIDGSQADAVAYEGVLFNNVDNSLIKNLSCLNVHITASTDTGNIRLNNCNYVLIENCNITETWKMGIFILNGTCNTIFGGRFYGTHDSAIGVVNSFGTTIAELYVDNCGTSDGSNMSLNSEALLVINNVSINAKGKNNGNGMTLGHDGSPASNSVCINNIIKNNRAKGIFIQGKNTKNVLVFNNMIIGNGKYSEGTNSGGIAVYSYTEGHLLSDNIIVGNKLGVSLHRTSKNVSIINNHIASSTLFGIRNDGENIQIIDNYLSNDKNIYNGMNHKNLSFRNNVTTVKTIDRE
ncbi:right-handed parallel beta-helix repeat-containing protein [Pareuzebyella sediminis]|uniref:right-handed parallel beta-helix repeat-containing protein n=1 Tax=Pareuzebyella sediminis TaxID=2607998 RepID=UPI0011EF3FDB|nr:right-handed parallel beta-helix repeat-containing protein [Pareuzebyella sediminis]